MVPIPISSVVSTDSSDGDLSIIECDKSLAIAVVGMSFRGPGDATSVENLWNMISERREAWSKVPKEKWNHDAFYHPDNKRHGTVSIDIFLFEKSTMLMMQNSRIPMGVTISPKI
jgi:Beta-ketoacyl synthase, N-terminal domain